MVKLPALGDWLEGLTEAANLTELAKGSTVWLAVTGLSRAGKTVFITSLIHNFLSALHNPNRMPLLKVVGEGRLIAARLEGAKAHLLPRFPYQANIEAMAAVPAAWPRATADISEIGIDIRFRPTGLIGQLLGRVSGPAATLKLKIVDYPGEWLLDLPLLRTSYEPWAAQSLARSHEPPRGVLARAWHRKLATLDPLAPADEQSAIEAARLFTEYLRACRDDRIAMSVLTPGRFLMPGDLDGSPALTFVPLDLPEGGEPPAGSLWDMMRRRFESYKDVVVRPFFEQHFLRLDRQVVLVDALAAFNAGAPAVHDLESALTDILESFSVGRRTLLSAIFAPRADRILFAATKADHLHQANHDRLESILRRMVDSAVRRATFSGAQVDVIALAAVRATREAQIHRGAQSLPSIAGIPAAGEIVNGRTFDGETEVAVFPGDLPDSPDGSGADDAARAPLLNFIRFRPPRLELTDSGMPALPHIRLDRALQFLIGDQLQ